MKLFQLRKGQFVYYQNELHRVYSVKPMVKKSVHLMKLKDLSQHICSAAEVDKYQPKELDSFIFNKNVYTLSKYRKAEEGDFILITNPNPDYLDHYSLNEIEVVASVENKGVITNKYNGIRHNEYLLMVPGRDDNSNRIEYRDIQDIEESNIQDHSDVISDLLPTIGDVYRKNDTNAAIDAMVVAIQGNTIILGGGLELPHEELMNNEKWEFLYSLLDK
ncbi:hypothetical protein [Paenisporosarcina indica]|uniref:hypothetical protein n=1 Tax=Paenisporosarcina indica TaxID=650093 RepID=UPI00094FA33E|nr:hypothetical protein [Paenisporosarcina indica]